MLMRSTNSKCLDKKTEKSKKMNLKKTLTTKNFTFLLIIFKLILFLVLNFNITAVFRDVCVYNGARLISGKD